MHELRSRFGLSRDPFSKDLPVEDFYWNPALEDARTRLRAALKGRVSAVLTGDSGTGKTFILRAVEKDLQDKLYRIEYIHHSTVNRREFYRQLACVLGLPPKASAAALFRDVSEHIEDLAAMQKVRPVLMLDEGHMLQEQVLTNLPILLNFQRDSKPFLSVVLAGLSELRELLTRNIYAALSSRIPVRIHLSPLDPREVADYVRHRLRRAGASQDIFTEESLLLIAEATSGVMRKIDVLAHACLEHALQGKTALVEATCVRDAVRTCAGAVS